MNRLASLSLASVLAASGCGGGGASDAFAPVLDLQSFRAGIDHRYFPLTPDREWTYEGLQDGTPRRDEVRVLAEPRVLMGVSCTGLQDDEFLDGMPFERTVEWYAEDRRGNVWKFGEESAEFDGVAFVPRADSWVAGVGGAVPWLAFPAEPRVGQTFVGGPVGGEDKFEVLSVTETVAVPLGTFANCLRLLENPDDPDDTDIILYAGGLGQVSEAFPGGRVDLVSVR